MALRRWRLCCLALMTATQFRLSRRFCIFQEIFKSIENEDDEDLEVSTMAGFIRKKGGKIIGDEESEEEEEEEVKTPKKKPKSTKRKAEEEEEKIDTDSDSDSDTYDVENNVDVTKASRKVKNQADKDGFEIVPQQKGKLHFGGCGLSNMGNVYHLGGKS